MQRPLIVTAAGALPVILSGKNGAMEAGIAPADVVKKVNNQKVNDIRAFKTVVANIDVARVVLLDIVRQ